MSYHFKPAKRENTPLIIGLAGPTKSGKTLSAHRLAVGLAQGGRIAMINTEGPRGRQYSDRFEYDYVDLDAPYRPEKYEEALKAALALEPKPAVVLIDSVSHMHNGPGGILEWHEAELDRIAGQDFKKRDRANWTAWIKPKAAETAFVYAMNTAGCHLVLCFRAKEKLLIRPGKEPVNLGWQPIAGDAITFETIFTLVLPPHSKGAPDLELSDMREPFDKLLPKGQLSEATGSALAHWSAGQSETSSASGSAGQTPDDELDSVIAGLTDELLEFIPEANHGAVTEQVAKNRASHAGQLGAHVAWLGSQLERIRSEAEASKDTDLDLSAVAGDTSTHQEGEPA